MAASLRAALFTSHALFPQTKTRGWRDDWVVKSSCCYSRGWDLVPSSYLGGSLLPIVAATGDLTHKQER